MIAVIVLTSACKSTNKSEIKNNKTISNQETTINLSDKSGGSILIQQSTPYNEHSVVADKIKNKHEALRRHIRHIAKIAIPCDFSSSGQMPQIK